MNLKYVSEIQAFQILPTTVHGNLCLQLIMCNGLMQCASFGRLQNGFKTISIH